MSCVLELPISGGSEGLMTRFRALLPDATQFAETLLVDAANEFYRETSRWRYVHMKVELRANDQEIRVEMPADAEGHVELCTIQDTIYQHNGNDCAREIPWTRKSDGTGHQFANGRGYQALDGNITHSRYYNHVGTGRHHRNEWYEPEPGHIMLAAPLDQPTAFRLELMLAPISLDGMDRVPIAIARRHREGIVSLAICKAMRMPNKAWTRVDRESGYNPTDFMIMHNQVAEEHKADAIAWHMKDNSEYRAHTDRMSVVLGDGYGDYR